jgi:hypothetical protein
MARRCVALVLLAFALAVLPRTALADQPGPHTVPVGVLAFESEEAEEQADALTGAVRSRVRASEAWSLVETPQSLGMLTAALRCPARPPPECQERIGEQIKAERYIWGVVSRGAGGQVTAELHLYRKGKSDLVFKESYADNLKDPQDDMLRKIAQRALEHFGKSVIGVVVVRAGNLDGEVVVDGQKRVPLKGGAARIELAPGGHAVELAVPGVAPEKRNVLVTAGEETAVELTPPSAREPVAPHKPFPTRKVIGGVALAAGIGLAALSVERTLRWSALRDEGEALRGQVPLGAEPCTPNTLREFCDKHRSAQGTSAVAWTAGAVGVVAMGAGIYLLFSSSGTDEKTARTKPAKPRVTPSFARSGGGLFVSGEF